MTQADDSTQQMRDAYAQARAIWEAQASDPEMTEGSKRTIAYYERCVQIAQQYGRSAECARYEERLDWLRARNQRS